MDNVQGTHRAKDKENLARENILGQRHCSRSMDLYKCTLRSSYSVSYWIAIFWNYLLSPGYNSPRLNSKIQITQALPLYFLATNKGMGSAFSCGEPRKTSAPVVARSHISRPVEDSRPLRNFNYTKGQTADGLKHWENAKDRRIAGDMRAQDLELETFFRGRGGKRQNDAAEPKPPYYDINTQRQQREPTAKSHTRRQPKFMSGVDHYPAFEEIVQHELQAPRTQFERFDHHKERRKRSVDSGVEQYAPMVAIDKYERPNPLALDSRFATAMDKLEGRADEKAGRSLTQKRKADAKGDPWGSDGGLEWPEDLFPQTRKEEKPHRRSEEKGRKGSYSSKSQQRRDRGRPR